MWFNESDIGVQDFKNGALLGDIKPEMKMPAGKWKWVMTVTEKDKRTVRQDHWTGQQHGD